MYCGSLGTLDIQSRDNSSNKGDAVDVQNRRDGHEVVIGGTTVVPSDGELDNMSTFEGIQCIQNLEKRANKALMWA